MVERVAPANLFAGTWLSSCKRTNSLPFAVVRLSLREIVRHVLVAVRLVRISCERGESLWLLESFDGPAQEVETKPRKWGAVRYAVCGPTACTLCRQSGTLATLFRTALGQYEVHTLQCDVQVSNDTKIAHVEAHNYRDTSLTAAHSSKS